MDEVTDSPNNDFMLEIDTANHQIVAYQDNYKVLGWFLLIVSLLPFSSMFVAPWPIRLVIGAFWLVPFAAGINLVFKERRQRWDHATQMVLFEARWPGNQFKPYKKIPIGNFEDVQIMATPHTNQRGIEATGPSIFVRVRHRGDSRHTYPGNNSWKVASFPTMEYADDAKLLAAKIAQECGVPVRDSLAN